MARRSLFAGTVLCLRADVVQFVKNNHVHKLFEFQLLVSGMKNIVDNEVSAIASLSTDISIQFVFSGLILNRFS